MRPPLSRILYEAMRGKGTGIADVFFFILLKWGRFPPLSNERYFCLTIKITDVIIFLENIYMIFS